MSKMRIASVEIRDADIFEILLDHFPDAIHSIDADGHILYTNRTAEKLLGYSREELLAMQIRQIYADEILDDVERGFSDLKMKGEKTVESILKARDGTRIPVEIRSFSIYDDHGTFLRTFSILRNIREIKELQRELQHADRLAAIGELASGVAHDISNPLTVILLSSDSMQRDLEQAPPLPAAQTLARVQERTDDIRRAARSIQKLSDHLRTFARGITETYKTVDLAETVADALFIMNSKLQNHTIEVEDRTVGHHYFTRGCSNQMEQVFVNLISNACDAMADVKTRHLSLSIQATQQDDGNYWQCDVVDSGHGIPPDTIDNVFNAFFTTKEEGQGTGLGLSISRAIVRDHKGQIHVSSKQGEGTTFSLCLPQLPEA